MRSQDRHEILSGLCKEHRVDVVALAEPAVDGESLKGTIAPIGRRIYELTELTTSELRVFNCNRKIELKEFQGFEASRQSILEFNFDDERFLLGVVHFRSKLWSDSDDQLHEAMLFSKDLRICEAAKGHQRSIVVGDLNMSPFESNVIGASSLHALTTKECVREGSQIFQGIEYPFLYNPMWRFFGDTTEGPPGTYYYPGGGRHSTLKWHVFDQVLLRPAVFPWWRENVRIITTVNGRSLATSRGRPDPEIGSDHFPVLFQLHSLRRG